MHKNQISFIIPYYNEEKYLADTLRSLLHQERTPDQIILIDNSSTDSSASIAHSILGASSADIRIKHLYEKRPGKIHALETALPEVDCEYVALGDADTSYPSHYLQRAEELFAKHGDKYLAVMALPVFTNIKKPAEKKRIRQMVRDSKKFPKKCFTGGFGQIFRTKALLKAGGFSYEQWPHCLMDHEIMNRVLKHGRSLYDEKMWCMPSPRREDKRQNVRWNMWERIVYKYSPSFMNDWVFYSFLDKRFQKRGLDQKNLRNQPWN
jgi:glycosyltransferase involved in cell wall biosynthesis